IWWITPITIGDSHDSCSLINDYVVTKACGQKYQCVSLLAKISAMHQLNNTDADRKSRILHSLVSLTLSIVRILCHHLE
ncbi:MAG: hypothetical protein ACRCYD_10815, partial [Plesiomonas sp.]